MKRRFLLAVISVVLMAAMILPLASCDLFGGLGGGEDESDSQGGDGAPVEDVVLFDKGSTGYTIVYPANCSTDLRTAALGLRDAIEAITGEDVNVAADDSKKYKESAKEICIGKTNREATTKAAEKFNGGVGYRYDMIDGKMTILGNSDYLTIIAVKAVIDEIFTVNGTKITVPSNLGEFVDKSADMTALIVDDPKREGKKMFLYRLVVPDGNKAMRDAAKNFTENVELALNKDKNVSSQQILWAE